MNLSDKIANIYNVSKAVDQDYTKFFDAVWNFSKLGWKAHEFYHQGKKYAHERRTRYSIQISFDDPFFDVIQSWLNENTEAVANQTRFRFASKVSRISEKRLKADDSTLAIEMSVTPNFKNASSFTLDGHKIQVFTADNEATPGDAVQHRNEGAGGQTVVTPGGRGTTNAPYKGATVKITPALVFYAKDQDGIDALADLFRSLVGEELRLNNYRPRTYSLNHFGDFAQSTSVLARRDPGSIFLDEGKMEGILDDVAAFIEAEPLYRKFDQPYHRGYLLYGPPGTGKTSIIKAVANHFNMDLYIANITSTKMERNGFDTIISAVKPYSILVIEDIDTLASAQDTSKKRRGTDESAEHLMSLLNGLDGLLTPRGVIVFLTTNFKEKLDPRLLRPGRVASHIEIGYMGSYALDQMFEYYYGVRAGIDIDGLEITPAKIAEIFKLNMENPDAAYTAVNDLAKFKRAKQAKASKKATVREEELEAATPG